MLAAIYFSHKLTPRQRNHCLPVVLALSIDCEVWTHILHLAIFFINRLTEIMSCKAGMCETQRSRQDYMVTGLRLLSGKVVCCNNT